MIGQRRGLAAVSLALGACAAGGAQPCDSWEFRSPEHIPFARSGHVLVYDAAHNYVLVFGGVGAQPRSDTWSWDGSDWTPRATSGPPARAGHAAVYDTVRGRPLLAGNPANAAETQTWYWDGQFWQQQLIDGPPGRFAHALAFDTLRGVAVLFGGGLENQEGLVLSDQTWEYDGAAWTLRDTPGGAPAPRYHHGMAFDVQRGVTVLYGGFTLDGVSGETWEWDGLAWRLAATGGPPAVAWPGMIYDASVRRVVLFTGGPQPEGEFQRTWLWDGQAWTRSAATDTMGWRFAMGVAYDAARATTVLFGGEISDGENSMPNNETWELRLCAPDVILGDLNCDGAVNNFDIDPFVLALTDPAAYAAAYPDCDISAADVNEDGAVNNFDIDAFVALLAGG